MNEMQCAEFKQAFDEGRLVVYPTEAVMGIGCDPDNHKAVNTLLALKDRPVEKGMILIADTYSRLLPYVDDSLISLDMRPVIFSSWPGPVTWLLPKSASAPDWITGGQDKIAVRVTNHPTVIDLCRAAGRPLVSTSANPSGLTPAKSVSEAKNYFGDNVIYIDGKTGGYNSPSTIRDCASGKVIRA
ncbi:Sua5/YciO/YrdC/YwlC family protein [Alteromonas sp. ASW11-130]|uniref:Sua5/YciO/YrdC/YwlC family protein n=1 Tax=Alteromonas sp. ASW11-130 TaxID=3015775 RepID=UPI0022423684|nr:Sua5/YciO/YrdC/YwlC family protein [Alteromonas sp. ASW11-130]MCW8093475.1 Sua5/YciO/YrdC/YwlC family protein [Alteromonas sp. ASW11-130]